jgi:hypothetical protein
MRPRGLALSRSSRRSPCGTISSESAEACYNPQLAASTGAAFSPRLTIHQATRGETRDRQIGACVVPRRERESGEPLWPNAALARSSVSVSLSRRPRLHAGRVGRRNAVKRRARMADMPKIDIAVIANAWRSECNGRCPSNRNAICNASGARVSWAVDRFGHCERGREGGDLAVSTANASPLISSGQELRWSLASRLSIALPMRRPCSRDVRPFRCATQLTQFLGCPSTSGLPVR